MIIFCLDVRSFVKPNIGFTDNPAPALDRQIRRKLTGRLQNGPQMSKYCGL